MKISHLIAAGAVALGLAAVGTPASAANLVADGNFTNFIDGWTLTGNTSSKSEDTLTTYLAAPAFAFQNSGKTLINATLSQSIATTPGQQYEFSFTLGNFSAGTSDFKASFGGDTVLSQTNAAAYLTNTYSFLVTASSYDTVISFVGSHLGSNAYDLSNVSVSAVPLPAALPMFGAALAGMGGWRLRRRKAAV